MENVDSVVNDLYVRFQRLEDGYQTSLPRIGSLEHKTDSFLRRLDHLNTRLDRELHRRRLHDEPAAPFASHRKEGSLRMPVPPIELAPKPHPRQESVPKATRVDFFQKVGAAGSSQVGAPHE